jgi:hypothetical protein
MLAVLLLLLLLILLFGGGSMAQDPVPPVAISAPVWHVDHRHITAQDNSRTMAQREMTADDKYYAREKRNNSVRGSAPEPIRLLTGESWIPPGYLNPEPFARERA